MADSFAREELQALVDAAHAALTLDRARREGFIRPDVSVDVARCETALRHAQQFSVFPAADEGLLARLQRRRCSS